MTPNSAAFDATRGKQVTPVASTCKLQSPLNDVSKVSQSFVLCNTVNHDNSSTPGRNSSPTSCNQVTPVDQACRRRSPISDVSNEYYDHGDLTFECKECHALLWEAEAKSGNLNPVNKAYSICCKKGKVMLEKPPATPKPLLDLFLNDDGKSQNFRNNIRTYNRMFALTSMGGKHSGNTDPIVLGKPVVLSSSFTGGPRYIRQNYMDTMALCRWYGYCPDVLSRVFKMKLDQLMKDVKDLRLFGRVQAAEIPDPNDNPNLYKLVSDFMMHGPCGEDYPSQACMVNRKCSEHFPKKFMQHSSIDSESYPVYRRRDNKKYVEKSEHHLHIGFVIPYNATLLKRYQCHINVEWCNQTGSIKYLFKYINKGPDRVLAELYEPVTTVDGEQIQKPVDEIKAYLDCRYLFACEVAWKLFGFVFQYRTPSIERLSFHLPGKQQVLYDENSDLETVLHKPSVGHSMFEGWMKMNELYPVARELTYAEFPTKYVWNASKIIWTLRKQGKSIGRIYNVPISTRDAFYCRMLLNSAKGYLVVNDVEKKMSLCFISKNLCDREDKEVYILYTVTEWYCIFINVGRPNTHSRFHIPINIDETSTCFFSQSDLGALLKKCKLIIWDEAPMTNKLCFEALDQTLRDVLRRTRYDTCEMPFGNMTMVFGGDFRQVLPVIPKGSRQDIVNTSLKQSYLWDHCKVLKLTANIRITIGASLKDVCEIRDFAELILKVKDGELGEANDGEVSIDVLEELLIDAVDDPVTSIIDFTYLNLLNNINNLSYFQEKAILAPTDEVVDTINDHLLNKFPKEEMVYLSCDSIDKTERGSAIDEAIFSLEFIKGLKFSDLVVSDEEKKNVALFYIKELMRSRDTTLRRWPEMPYPDERYISEFGNRLIYDELDYNPAELQSEYERLYDHWKVLKLTANMRLTVDASPEDVCEIRDFTEWILKVGDGELGEANDGEVSIDVPEELLIDAVDDHVTSIIDFTYSNLLNNINNPSYFLENAILAPTNEVVDTINDHLLNKFPREEIVYLSCDSIDKTQRGSAIDEAVFSPEFINGLKFSGVPNHTLALKVGVPIMLLRNIDQANGLCNGTRLQVLRLTRTSIQAKIINGTHFENRVIIPRLRITPSDKRLPIKIVRKQYPLSLSFAMTINKNQGQSLSKVGLYLPRPIFTHEQLYVALSRVKSKRGLKVVVCDEEGNVSKTTTNVVYKEVLHGP
nr:hypothetical protein [Tanacetum cinerariifolium]